MADGPHGLRIHGDDERVGIGDSDPATCFPPAVTLASSWDEQLAYQVGAAVGVEARCLGVGLVLGPGLNIKRHPLCGRNFEYFSEDPLVSGRLAAAMVEGIQSTGVGACLKHFAVNNQESRRFVVDAIVDERTMRELYLPGFEYAVRTARPWAVMAAYNRVNGTYAGEHPQLLRQILRGEWGFDGLVVSDWAATSDRPRSIEAGVDLEMPGSRGLFDQEVLRALAAGRLSAAAVAHSAQRVVHLISRAPRPQRRRLPVDEHHDLAARVAAEGTVLLSNDGVLPLSGRERVAVIGAFAEHPRYQGSGSSLVNATRITSAVEAFADRGVIHSYAAGYEPVYSGEDPELIRQAVEAARAADVAVVLVGLPAVHESEGFDRESLALPAQHDRLVQAVAAANPRTVVALSNGSPVLMPWKDDVAAILECYLGGQASGAALVSVLFGDTEPGGRLAETFPARLQDVASDPWFPGGPFQVEYREGLFVGYRHQVSAGLEPLFAFGHGLGYTRIDWSDPAVDSTELTPGTAVTVSVRVTNTGERPGSDVVQVYLADRTGVVLRPERQLVAFAKVRLEPAESRVVQLCVPARAFAYCEPDSGAWTTPQGGYELLVARSSEQVVARLPVQVRDGATTSSQPAELPPVASTDDEFARRLGRPVPVPRQVRPFTRDSPLGDLAPLRVGRLLRALVSRGAAKESRIEDVVTREMLARSIEEFPLRTIAIYSKGALRLPVVDAILALANQRLAGAGTGLLRRVWRRADSGRSD